MVLAMKWEFASETVNFNTKHCVKSVIIRSFFWSAFSRIWTEYFVSLCIQYDCGKIRTRKQSVFGHFSRSENYVLFEPIWGHSNRFQKQSFVDNTFKKFINSTGKHLCLNLLACNSIKKKLRYRCFPVKFIKFLRTPFFIEQLQWLLLKFNSCF